jgi:hypothetical protein
MSEHGTNSAFERGREEGLNEEEEEEEEYEDEEMMEKEESLDMLGRHVIEKSGSHALRQRETERNAGRSVSDAMLNQRAISIGYKRRMEQEMGEKDGFEMKARRVLDAANAEIARLEDEKRVYVENEKMMEALKEAKVRLEREKQFADKKLADLLKEIEAVSLQNNKLNLTLNAAKEDQRRMKELADVAVNDLRAEVKEIGVKWKNDVKEKRRQQQIEFTNEFNRRLNANKAGNDETNQNNVSSISRLTEQCSNYAETNRRQATMIDELTGNVNELKSDLAEKKKIIDERNSKWERGMDSRNVEIKRLQSLNQELEKEIEKKDEEMTVSKQKAEMRTIFRDLDDNAENDKSKFDSLMAAENNKSKREVYMLQRSRYD